MLVQERTPLSMDQLRNQVRAEDAASKTNQKHQSQVHSYGGSNTSAGKN